MWEKVDPCPLALIIREPRCFNDPMTAAHPFPAASLGAGNCKNQTEFLAPSPSPHCGVWGFWDGYLTWVPITIHAHLGIELEPAPWEPKILET